MKSARKSFKKFELSPYDLEHPDRKIIMDTKFYGSGGISRGEFQSDNMLGLLLSLRYSRRKENRDRFRLMCENYAVQCAVPLAPLVSDALFDGSLWSGVYQ